MKETIILILKGIIIGAGKIIPGVSGGMLAMTLNVYDRGIKAISEFFKDIKNNLYFLLKIGIGIILSILIFSKIINYSLNNYYLPTMFLFIGLIIGGIPSIIKEVKQDKSLKNINIMLAPIVIIFSLSIISSIFQSTDVKDANFFILVLMGIIDAVTMIVPGISGTAILMMLGYYNIIINSFSNLTNITILSSNLSIIIPFLIGLIIGVIALSKVINYILNKHRISCYYAIIGFTISSVFLLLKNTFKNNYNFIEILISLLLLYVGYHISKKLDKLS